MDLIFELVSDRRRIPSGFLRCQGSDSASSLLPASLSLSLSVFSFFLSFNATTQFFFFFFFFFFFSFTPLFLLSSSYSVFLFASFYYDFHYYYLSIYIHIYIFFFDFFHLPFSSHSICCCSIDAISFIMQSFRFRLCFWGFCLVSSFCFKKEKEKEKKKEKLAQRIYRKIFWPAARLLSAIQKREREKDLPRQRRSIWSCLLCVDGSCRCQLMSAHRRQHRS